MNCVRNEFRHSESRLYRSLLAHEDEIITSVKASNQASLERESMELHMIREPWPD